MNYAEFIQYIHALKPIVNKIRHRLPLPWQCLTRFLFACTVCGVIITIAEGFLRGPPSLLSGLAARIARQFRLTDFHWTDPRFAELATHQGVQVSDPAKRLPKSGRLLCFVLTSPKYYATRALAVNETWLPRCDHGQFFANIPMDPSIPHSTVLRGIPDDYKYLFQKTMLSFHYAYTKISDQFDWYYKADDDTYVVMEHMYEYLATLDPAEPYYLGYTLKPYLNRGYNGGGAGYVLSRAALKLFIERAFFDRSSCPIDQSEDVGMGRCLQNIEIYPHDTRNKKGQNRFNTYHPRYVFEGTITDEWHYFKQITGHAWIAPELISVHHVSAPDMRIYDDLLYRMRSPQLSTIRTPNNIIIANSMSPNQKHQEKHTTNKTAE